MGIRKFILLLLAVMGLSQTQANILQPLKKELVCDRHVLENIISFIILLLFVSCSKGMDEVADYYEMDTKDGKKVYILKDTVINIMIEDFESIRTTAIDDERVETLNRFIDKRTEKFLTKMKLGQWCIKYGLSPSVCYIARKEYYFNQIPDFDGYASVQFVPLESKKRMGFMPTDDNTFRIGYQGGNLTSTPPFAGVKGNCWTVIYHIEYDSYGNNVNQYFPCSPENLKWFYSWFKR